MEAVSHNRAFQRSFLSPCERGRYRFSNLSLGTEQQVNLKSHRSASYRVGEEVFCRKLPNYSQAAAISELEILHDGRRTDDGRAHDQVPNRIQ